MIKLRKHAKSVRQDVPGGRVMGFGKSWYCESKTWFLHELGGSVWQHGRWLQVLVASSGITW